MAENDQDVVDVVTSREDGYGDTTRALQPTADARLPHLAQLPTENLTPGTYELRVAVTDTVDQQSRSTFFTVGG